MSGITVAALTRRLGGAAAGLALLTAGAAPAMAAPASPAAPLSGTARSVGTAATQPSLPDAGVPRPVPITSATPNNCQNHNSQPQQPNLRTVTQTPWAENALNFEGAWPLTTGAGITVAVVDSGVDYSPQLHGRVSEIDLSNTGPMDCVGHGTAVAGIIAASNQVSRGNPFAGVAPDAQILSVKVQDQDTNGAPGGNTVLADGIADAAALGAKVISVSIQTPADTSQLRDAVAFAERENAVIVAAGGNDGETTTGQILKGPFYPASYPGVLSVGALGPDGSLGDFSDTRSDVQVTAPGVDITSLTAPFQYYNKWSGTSFATPFVSGVAALIRSRYPTLSAQQVVQRIVDTADGSTGPGTGAGMVNPLQAVTAVLAPGGGQNAGPRQGQPVPVARAVPSDPGIRNAAMLITVGSVGGAALLVAAALVIIEGRRRRWRPREAGVPETMTAAPSVPGLGSAAIPADPSDVLGGG